jgi:alkylated DNA repair dioxygenase AlkB
MDMSRGKQVSRGSRYQNPSNQGALFDLLPEGFAYQPDFITADQEAELLTTISGLPLREAKYKEYTAKRRIISYGASYDFSSSELVPAGPVPAFLHPLRDLISKWTEVPASRFTHAVIAEYKTGTQLGWHRDVPDFELIAGVSLGGSCRMRFRPHPPENSKPSDHLSVQLEPRSAYFMRGKARWRWQHSIAPTKMTRYSITFRTRRG